MGSFVKVLYTYAAWSMKWNQTSCTKHNWRQMWLACRLEFKLIFSWSYQVFYSFLFHNDRLPKSLGSGERGTTSATSSTVHSCTAGQHSHTVWIQRKRKLNSTYCSLHSICKSFNTYGLHCQSDCLPFLQKKSSLGITAYHGAFSEWKVDCLCCICMFHHAE